MSADRIEHTARALEICAEHWMPERTRCHGCPIQAECGQPVAPLTIERLRLHVDAVNAAAEAVPRP